MKAIIMAGGKGSRLMPLTSNIPKPLVPIIDKPIMEHIIGLLTRVGITEIGVTLGYKAEKIVGAFGSGERLGAKLTYFIENSPLGTAGSVKGAENFLSDEFIVLSGDAYTTVNLQNFIDFHHAKNSLFTIMATRKSCTMGLGLLSVSDAGKLATFNEKSPLSGGGLVNCGIYCMHKKLLDFIPQNTFYDFGKDFLPRLLDKAYVFVTSDYWSDIGTLPAYYYANYLAALEKEAHSVPQ